ncbi:MAG: cytochrome c oxidase assembly protein [Anaerolineae bacterium]
MDPILKAALSSWDWRPSVIIVLALAGTFFMTGWWRLRQRTLKTQHAGDGWQASAIWRPISYVAGLLFIGLALMSPLDVLGTDLFSMHMTTPGVIWMVWLISIIGWHDPNAYNLALRNNFVHDMEHLTFFFGGMLFWWHVTGAGPRIHKQFGLVGRTAFVLSAVPPNMLIGVAIAFASSPIYTYYNNVPRLMGLSVLEDQQLGGVIMWVPGSMMYIIAALVLISRLLQGESSKPVLPEAEWGSDEALIAPGMKK